MPSVPTVIDMDTGEALPLARGGSSSSSSSSSGSKKGGNFVSDWWGGLSTEQQVGLVGTGLSVGVPLLVTGAKKLYAKYKNWRAKKKGANKTTKPTNQTYQGRTSINYTTGGGTDAIVPFNSYGDGGETVAYASPLILP